MPEIKSFYDCYSEHDSNSILLGNGFSTSICGQFSYKTLYEEAVNNQFLEQDEIRLFNEFKTENFEEILNLLSIAKLVNSNLDIDDNNILADHYDSVKNALIRTIHFIHPSFSSVDIHLIRNLGAKISQFDNIYTTNYDIILYWIILNHNDNYGKFTDLFFNDYHSFQLFYELHEGYIPIFYLHGALHLNVFRNTFTHIDEAQNREVYFEQELTTKLTCRSNDLLHEIETFITNGGIPLFVSEGNYRTKMNEIKKNDYLFHCYNHLYNLNSNLFIFGHSLSESDKHIADAINNSSSIQNIYFGLYLPAFTDQLAKDNEMLRIRNLLNKKNITFYDTSTF